MDDGTINVKKYSSEYEREREKESRDRKTQLKK